MIKINIPICNDLFIHICSISLAAMESTLESTINVSSSLAVEGSANLQLASSNAEAVNLSHDDTVDLNNHTQVNLEGKVENIVVLEYLLKNFWTYVQQVNSSSQNFNSKCRRIVS